MTTGRAFALGLLLSVATTASFLMQGRAPAPSADPTLDPIGNQSVNELVSLDFTATASDPDLGDTLLFSLDATSLGKGMTINPVSGDFSWTPTELQDGPHSVTITVTDFTLGTDSETITIDVNEVNVAPTLSPIADKACFEANAQGSNPQTVNFFAAGADTDFVLGVPNALSYTLDATSLGKGMTINPATGEFLWAPTELQDGIHSVTVTVHDNQIPDLTADRTFSITVTEVNEPPVITIAADGFLSPVFHGQGIWRDVTLSDPDVVLGVPNTVTASLDVNPDANYNPATGHWVIAPKAPAAGPFVSTLTATDSGLPPFAVPMTFPYTAMAPPGHDYAIGGHAGEIRQVDADGTDVVTAAADSTAKIWGDLGSYYLKRTLAGHNGPLTGVMIRGGTVITSSEDGYLIEWDRATGAMLSVSPAHAGPVNCLARNVVADAWVTGGQDWHVKVWTGFPGPALDLMGHTNAITDVAGWGPWTVSGSKDKTVRLWFGTMLSWPVITDHAGEITAVDLFADGGPDRWVATAAKDRKFNLYKNAVKEFSLDLGEVVTEIRFELALDGRIFVGTESGKLHVVDRTGTVLFTYADATGPIRSIKHFGSFVYVTGADRAVRWYYLVPGPGLTLIRELSAHGDWITNVSTLFGGGAFTPYVTGSWDGKAIFWDALGMSRLATLNHGSPLVAGLASPFSTVGRDGSLKFWAFGVPDWTVAASAMNPEAPWSAATFLGMNALVGAQNGNVRMWDTGGTNVFTFNTGSPVTSMDGTRPGAPVVRIATGGSDGVVKVFNPIPTVEWTFSGHMGPAMGVSFSRNGRRLAVAAGMIYVYDLTTGAQLMAVMERTGIGSCAMNPTGETVAVIQHPNIVRVYRVFDGAVVYTSPSEPGLYATSINWNDMGDRLTVTRSDGSFYRVDMGGSGPVPPIATISAPVAFRDTVGTPNSVSVRVYRKGTNDLVKEDTVLVSSDGRIRLDLDRGEYDVIAKSSTFLARKVGMDLRTQNEGQLAFDLRNGDVNGDNSVNIADFLLVRKAFGSSQGSAGYLAGADLNKDGRVDIRDFIIVRRTFGMTGDN